MITMRSIPIQYTTVPDIQVMNISWERIFLNITIQADRADPLSFSLMNVKLSQVDPLKMDNYEGDCRSIPATLTDEIPLTPHRVEGSTYYFRLNITTINKGGFLDNGRWYIATREAGEKDVVFCSVSYDESYRLCDHDRIFPYKQTRYSYTVQFVPTSFDSETIVPVLHSRFMIRNDNWRDAYATGDRSSIKGKLSCILFKLKTALMQFIYNTVEKRSKKDGSRVLFMTETKPYLWGNLKYIDDRLKERGLDKQLAIDYSLHNAVGKKNSKRGWLMTIKKLAAQDFIFIDDYAPTFTYLKLSDRTKLVQVWHAGVGFKSIGYSRFGMVGTPHPAVSAHRGYDYVITGSQKLVEVYSEAFGVPEEKVLPLGMARLDGFLDEDVVAKKTSEFYAAHPECKGKELILFCPTFRGADQKHAHYKYNELDLKEIYDFCGDEYIWAFKMHPFVRNKVEIPEEYRNRIIDLTDSQNINDLYYVTDIMITDYSSAYYEYSLLKRPVLFFTYDRNLYETVRGVHRNIKDTAPGKVCDTFEELLEALKNKDFEIEKTIRFYEENFGEYDGKAADRIIDAIILGR